MNRLLHTFILALTIAMGLSVTAHAHKPSDSYLRITGGKEQLSIQWDIALKDLEFLIGLDADQNGDITWGELNSQRPAISAHALSRLKISSNGTDYPLETKNLLVTQHSDGAYAVLELQTDCPGSATRLSVSYDLLFEYDPTHRGLVLYSNAETSSSHVLSPESPTVDIDVHDHSLFATFADYVWEGVIHIWIGTDHILFLLSLLLPAVYIWRNNTWEAGSDAASTWLAVFKIVTMFTLAHSITLWLSVMEIFTLPSRFVEATIAFSIVVTAINNLYPIVPNAERPFAFFFGLIHGFGFANVLLDLGLSSVTLGISLLGFNVGVELGQIAIVLVFLPIALLLRNTSFYRRWIFQAGSVVVALIAATWMYERICNVEILGF